MRVLVLLSCVWLAAGDSFPVICDGVTFAGKYYDKENILSIGVYSLSYVKSTNTLFFIYAVPSDQFSFNFYTSGFYNIDTKEFSEISEVPGATTTTVDPETEDVFIGGKYGVYKLNPKTKAVERYAANGVNIYSMYFNKVLYYTTWPQSNLYSYKDGEIKKLTEVEVERLAGEEKEYVFINGTGVFKIIDKNEENVIKLADHEKDITYKYFARDNNNMIYVIARNSRRYGLDIVYVINGAENKLDKVADFRHIYGLAFDKDNNIIYSDSDNIIKLTPSKETCTPS